jgi:hypothetical protein
MPEPRTDIISNSYIPKQEHRTKASTVPRKISELEGQMQIPMQLTVHVPSKNQAANQQGPSIYVLLQMLLQLLPLLAPFAPSHYLISDIFIVHLPTHCQ